MDDYQILGVSKTATDEELKKALKDLQKKYHPDANIGNENTAKEKFQEAAEAYQNIQKSRKSQTSFNTTTVQTSNDDWFQDWSRKVNEFERKRKDLEGKETSVKNKTSQTKEDLNSAKSEFNESNIKRNHHYGEIRISLIHLLSQTNKYYYLKIEELNRSLLSVFKEKTRLDILKESEIITAILENTQKQIEECFKSKDDSILFTINFKEEEIKLLQTIASNEFNLFIKNLQEYQKEHDELTTSIQSSSDKIIQLEEKLDQFNILLQKIEKELFTLKELERNLLWNDIFETTYNNSYSEGTSRK